MRKKKFSITQLILTVFMLLLTLTMIVPLLHILARSLSVSYTHLDVYKRQDTFPFNMISCNSSDSMNCYVHTPRNITVLTVTSFTLIIERFLLESRCV